MTNMPEKIFVKPAKGYCPLTDRNHWLGDDTARHDPSEDRVEYVRVDIAYGLTRTPTTTSNLRDQFAMAALTGLLTGEPPSSQDMEPRDYASDAYKYADAMLEARKKEGER